MVQFPCHLSKLARSYNLLLKEQACAAWKCGLFNRISQNWKSLLSFSPCSNSAPLWCHSKKNWHFCKKGLGWPPRLSTCICHHCVQANCMKRVHQCGIVRACNNQSFSLSRCMTRWSKACEFNGDNGVVVTIDFGSCVKYGDRIALCHFRIFVLRSYLSCTFNCAGCPRKTCPTSIVYGQSSLLDYHQDVFAIGRKEVYSLSLEWSLTYCECTEIKW